MKHLLTTFLLAASVVAMAQDTKKPAAPAKATPAASGFVGNKDTKVFHKADCVHVGKIKESNRTSFASAAEATKAGYHPCKVCKP